MFYVLKENSKREDKYQNIIEELTELLPKIKEDVEDIKEKLKLDENSKVLFFSTEGDTDKESYKSIVWDGKYQRK